MNAPRQVLDVGQALFASGQPVQRGSHRRGDIVHPTSGVEVVPAIALGRAVHDNAGVDLWVSKAPLL